MQDSRTALAQTAHDTRPGMGPDTREALIAQHMGLVRHVASRWAAMGGGVLDRDDLVGYGTIGLIEAVDRYDYERGNGFASYAIHRIRGAMLDAARSLDPLPRTVRRRVSQVDRARSALTPSLGREPLREELCNAAGLTEGEYRDAMTVASRMAISLESLVGQDDGNRDNPGFLQPTDPADDAFTGDIETRELLDDLAEAIARLPERERLVVTLYFKEGLDLREVAAVLDVSASRISQLKTRALGKLRVALQWHEAAA